ncbi:MAG: hypothetical protein R6U89_03200 [Dehalococcoidia bacterium]
MTTRSGNSNISAKQFNEFTAAVVSQLWAAAKDVDPEEIQRLTGNQEELKEILKKALSGEKPPAGHYPVTVDYQLELDEAIKRAKFDWVNPDITPENFPPKGKGTVDAVVELIHFDRYISTNEALKELRQRGYQPAALRELLALGEKNPNIHKEFPIVALGSVWQDERGERNVPCIYRSGKARQLRLVGYGGGWYARWRFAAVRK